MCFNLGILRETIKELKKEKNRKNFGRKNNF